MKNEIIIFQPDELNQHIEVRVDEEKETFWLTQEQMAQLFDRDSSVISKHLRNIFNMAPFRGKNKLRILNILILMQFSLLVIE
jgi:hypothetical protein